MRCAIRQQDQQAAPAPCAALWFRPKHAVVSVSTPPRCEVLPQQPHPAQGSQAAKYPHRRGRQLEVGRFRVGEGKLGVCGWARMAVSGQCLERFGQLMMSDRNGCVFFVFSARNWSRPPISSVIGLRNSVWFLLICLYQLWTPRLVFVAQ